MEFYNEQELEVKNNNADGERQKMIEDYCVVVLEHNEQEDDSWFRLIS